MNFQECPHQCRASFVEWEVRRTVPCLYVGVLHNSGEGMGKPGVKSQLQHSLMGTVVKILTFLKPQFLFRAMGISNPPLRRCCD